MMKKFKKRKMLVLAAIAVIIFSVTVAASFASMNPGTTCEYNSKDMRPLYFGCEFQKQWLGELPDMPRDFYDIRNLFQYRFVTFEDKVLNESYWMQPEWYPNYQTNIETIKMQNINRRTAAWCVGVYPSEFYVQTVPGRNLTLYFWVKNIPIQPKLEGVGIYPVYPPNAEIEGLWFNLGFAEVRQNESYAKENIRISATPSEIILSPSYPALQQGYTKIIRVDVNLSESIENGRYVAGFMVREPSREFSVEARLDYGFGYTDPLGEFGCSPRHYYLFVEVV